MGGNDGPMYGHPFVSVVVPVYNEVENIRPLF